MNAGALLVVCVYAVNIDALNPHLKLHFKYNLNFLNLFILFMNIYECTTCVPGAPGGQKRALDPLELKLHMVGNDHVGAGNQIQVLCKGNNPLNH